MLRRASPARAEVDLTRRLLIAGVPARRVALAVGLLLLIGHSYMWPSLSLPNERSRIYLSVALVDEGTVAIDGPMKRFGYIGDRARFEGRSLTDKAPGSSLLAAVPYAIARVFTAPEAWSITELISLARTWVMLPLALLGFVAMRRTLLLVFDDDDTADLGATGWLLTTTAFHYSGAFYGHQIVAVMLLVALWQILAAERVADRGWRYAIAGMCAGVAGLTEYQAGVPCLMLTAWVVLSPGRSVRRLAAFGGAALPALVVLLAYNDAAFGGPLEVSYDHLATPGFAKLHAQGIGGVALPDFSRLSPVLWSLHRGLLLTSPIFLLVVPGAALLWWRGERRLAALSLGVGVYFLLIIIGAEAWFGGWSFGLRLMVPAFPWMIIAAMAPLALLRERALPEVITRALLGVGLLYQQVVHALLPEVPPWVANPLVDVVYPFLGRGLFAPNRVADLTGVDDQLWVLLPLAALTVGWLIWMITPRGPWMAPAGERRRWAHRAAGCLAAAVAVMTLLGLAHNRGRSLSEAKQVKLNDLFEDQRARTRRMSDDARRR